MKLYFLLLVCQEFPLKLTCSSLVIIAYSVQSYFMWDSFTSGVATSIMHKSRDPNGENDFAEMEFMNITVVTSNKPYGISDGSNPFFDGLKIPRFNLKKGGVHSGHVQTQLRDPFCLDKNGKGRCQVIFQLKQKMGSPLFCMVSESV